MKKLKEIMQAIETLQNEKLITEKIAGKLLESYVDKMHKEKLEEIGKLNP